MLHCKSSPVLKTASRSALAPVALPVRPLRPCRFKGDDVESQVKDAQQKASGKLNEGGNAVQNAAQDVASKLRDATSTAGSSKVAKMDAQVKVNWLTAAFTRRREIFAGRLAIAGFTAAGFWEWLLPSHPNILQQISAVFSEAGLDVSTTTVLYGILGLVVYNAYTALAPWSPSWSEANQRDVAKRPTGPLNDGAANGAPLKTNEVQSFFGVTGVGFSKANENFVGRMAMVGFAAALIGQMVQGGVDGPGYIAQVANYVNVNPEWLYSGVPKVFLAWTLLQGLGAVLNDNKGTTQGEEDIY